MSIELKEAAQQALKELGEARKIIRASSSRQLAKDWDRRATDALANLRIAIQQPEPVVDVRCEGCGYMTHHREHMGCVRAAKQHTRQASSVPMTNEQWDGVLGLAGPDMLDLAKQWADNKVHVYQVVNEAEKIVKAAVLRGISAQQHGHG